MNVNDFSVQQNTTTFFARSSSAITNKNEEDDLNNGDNRNNARTGQVFASDSESGPRGGRLDAQQLHTLFLQNSESDAISILLQKVDVIDQDIDQISSNAKIIKQKMEERIMAVNLNKRKSMSSNYLLIIIIIIKNNIRGHKNYNHNPVASFFQSLSKNSMKYKIKLRI